jgi:hypothetical protein
MIPQLHFSLPSFLGKCFPIGEVMVPRPPRVTIEAVQLDL